MNQILFIHDTDISLKRGAELTISQLIALGNQLGFSIEIDYLSNFEDTKRSILNADLIVYNSTSRCSYEIDLITLIINSKKKYIKVEYDYNFCVRRNILCEVDFNITRCCNPEKFHIYQQLYNHAQLNVFQSPKHFEYHKKFFGESVANHLILPPTIEINDLNISNEKSDVIPFFGDLNHLKGGFEYVEFAKNNPKLKFEVYGNNDLNIDIPKNIIFKSYIENKEVLNILGKTKTYLIKPFWPEPSSRLAAEAFLSGCELITNDKVGTWSFDFYPKDKEIAKKEIKEAPNSFWQRINEILSNNNEKTNQKLGRVLAYKSYGGLGDIFFLLPSLYKLKEVCNHLDFAVEKKHFEFFNKYLSGINIVLYDEAKLNELKYDIVIEYGNHPSFNKKDFPTEIEYITTNKINQHAIQHYIDATCKFHPDIENNLEKYPFFEYEKDNFSTNYYVIHAGAGFIHKAWPAQNFAKLVEELKSLFPSFESYVVKGPDDPDLEDFLNKSTTVKYVTGNLLEVGKILENAKFFIGNDAGITHVAGAFNVPTVAIYGPTGPGSWGSFAQHNEIIWGKQFTCFVQDCNYHKIVSCDHKICLNSVSTTDVITAVYKLISKVYDKEDDVILKINPKTTFIFEKNQLLLHLENDSLDIEIKNKLAEKELKLIFEKNIFKDDFSEDIWQLIDFLLLKQYIFQLPQSFINA